MKRMTMMGAALFLAAGMVFAGPSAQGGGSAAGAGGGASATAASLPRNQTLYYNGLQWGALAGYNPYGGGSINNQMGVGGHRQLVYETLFVWNLLDGKLYPQIGDSYTWNGQSLTIKLNPNVKFRDGTPCTSADVVYTFELAKKYSIAQSAFWEYIDSVTASGPTTVVIKGKASNFNPKYIEVAISEFSITSKAYWEKQNPPSDSSWLAQFAAWDCVGTGPYERFYEDETKVVLVRVDGYWGQHSSRYGKLPAPKYIAHNIFKDNASGDEALRRGEVDVGQQFTAQIWRMWEQGAKVETYIPNPPYYFPGSIPMIIFNTTKAGLDDPVVRKAIAMSLDYDMIGTNAMSGYTPKLVPSLMLPTPAEQSLIDVAALKQYQWNGVDVAGANKLLDQAGWVKGADGIRAKGGVKLSFKAECPYGWSDWNATLEVVAQSTKAVGIDVQTYFPEMAIWVQDRENCSFDILMDGPGSPGAASPWNRAFAVMGSMALPPLGSPNRIQNYGRWVNQRANQIIPQLATETDAAKLKAMWTELNIIFLQEMPAVPLMYRPWLFHEVNTSVWTGFPKFNDGSNIPPAICADGYGIKALYNLRAK